MRVLTQFRDGDYDVTWYRYANGSFKVVYGQQIKTFKKREDVEACHEFGECVRHSLECAGKLG